METDKLAFVYYYRNVEVADMQFVYDCGNRNSLDPRRIYAVRYPNQLILDGRILTLKIFIATFVKSCNKNIVYKQAKDNRRQE